MQQVTVGGKVYGIPLVIETLVLYYNKDLLKTPPKTFNELEDLTKDKRFAFLRKRKIDRLSCKMDGLLHVIRFNGRIRRICIRS